MTLSHEALNKTARALADMGEDYGWNVYYKGTKIPASAARRMIADDENAQSWIEAFRHAVKQYRDATGEPWTY